MAARYHPVSTRFWIDEKSSAWDNDTQFLALYLLTCPHRTSEGLFRLPQQYILADLKWSPERLREPFAKLLEDHFIEYDQRVSVILLCQALKYQQPANPNQEIGAMRAVEELPSTPLLKRFTDIADVHAKRFAERLRERFAQSLSLTQSPTLHDDDPPPAPTAPENWNLLRSYVNEHRPGWLIGSNVEALMLEAAAERGADLVQLAVEQAVLYGGEDWPYTKRILANWDGQGITTVDQAKAAIAKWEAKAKRKEGKHGHAATTRSSPWGRLLSADETAADAATDPFLLPRHRPPS